MNALYLNLSGQVPKFTLLLSEYILLIARHLAAERQVTKPYRTNSLFGLPVCEINEKCFQLIHIYGHQYMSSIN